MPGAIDRWRGFLGQIEGRHREVRAEGEASGRQFVMSIAAGGDPLPLSHQLMALKSRLQDLESKIEDTWHAKVSDAFSDEGIPDEVRDREFYVGRDLKHSLDDLREEIEPRLFAELARQRYQHALAQAREVHCQACGRRREAPITFRIVELACSCGARTLFDPGELMLSVAGIGSHAIAQEASVQQWRAMRAAEYRKNRYRPPAPLEAVIDVERSQIAYWHAYLQVRSQFEPEMGRDLTMEIRSRMEDFYVRHAEYEPAWVQAGRPRSI